jgi:hypothetical protein
MVPRHPRRLRILGHARQTVAIAALCALTNCSSGEQRPTPQPPPGPPAATSDLFVSPDGRPDNDGTRARPFDLATALSSRSPAQPGATIWLEGGVYKGGITSVLTGRANSPIVVRAAPGASPVIDGATSEARQSGAALEVRGAHTWFWGLEVTYSGTSRVDSGSPTTPHGVSATQSTGIKFINMVVHDMPGQAVGLWSESTDTELYGSLIFNNGTNQFDHGVYAQNRDGVKRLEDNVIFGQASHGIHVYGSEAAFLDHFRILGNAVFNNGLLTGTAQRNLLVGGLREARDLVIANNVTYYPPDSRGSNNVGYQAGCGATSITQNYFVGYNALTLAGCTPTTLVDNTFIGATEPSDLRSRFPDNVYGSVPATGVRTFVRRNRYEQGRALVVIVNWDLRPEVHVDLSSAGLTAGRQISVADVQNLRGGAVLTTTYTGTPIPLPLTGLRAAAPTWSGAVAPRHTTPEFAVFLVTSN